MFQRRINKRVLLLCKGFNEYTYAKGLRMELPRSLQRDISIEIFHQVKNDPKGLVAEAKKKVAAARKDRNPFDVVWLFFDNDISDQLSEVFMMIKREKFELAYSSMYFEQWLILHFEECDRTFAKREEAIFYLQNLWPEYSRTRTNVYKDLNGRLEIAIKRAEVINGNQNMELSMCTRNPYFTIKSLIDFFRELENGK